jgi:4-diphosphocytidyl-2-C-methyl-D-erythritol kinase
LKRDTKPAIVADFLAAPKRFGQNDLQDAAVAYQASSDSSNDIGLALEVMQNQFGNSRMTGSGSAVFSWVPPEQTSHLTSLQPSDLGLNDALWIGRVCRGLPQHPLLKMLDQIAD